MTKDELIELINHTVYENEDGDITGEVMNLVLNAIVATIGVEANPDDDATGTLNKIKIGEEVFDVEGGGGTIDPTPTEGSTNPVQSGGVYEALDTLIPRSSLFGGFITDSATPNPDDSRRYFLTPLDGELPNFEIYNLPDNGKWKFIHWNPRDAAWDWETIDSYTSAQIYQLLGEVAAAISGKQDTISDLATIRSGAAAGATAYQKPSGGIPKTDLASGVQTSLGKADTLIQNMSTPLSPDGTITATKANGDTIIIDLNHQHPNYYSKVAETTQPSGGMLPDVTYKLGTLTGATTFSFAAAVSGNVNHYYFTFISGSTAVVPTWPASITSWDGNCVDSTTGLPLIAASKTYEVSVLDGNAIIKEW